MSETAHFDLLCWRLARDIPKKDRYKAGRLIAPNSFKGSDAVRYIMGNTSFDDNIQAMHILQLWLKQRKFYVCTCICLYVFI